MPRFSYSTAVALLALAAHGASAHHSFAAEFDYDRTGAIEGEVVEALYVNPHARYFVAVTDADGNEVIWDTQTRSISALARVGWTEDSIRIGDRVRMEGNLGKGDTHKLWIQKVTKPDGSVILPVAGEQQ